jgi:hypothetical protein
LEQWKRVIIDNIEWNYEVSTLGNVRNVDTSRILKSRDNGNGYLIVKLYKNGKQKTFYVHRLVAFAFIENDEPTKKTDVNHIDENKYNNHVNNLEWTTHDDNVHHGTGIERSTKARSKKVRCIETNTIYESTCQASRETGLHQSHICNCCNGKSKSCGGFHWEYVD